MEELRERIGKQLDRIEAVCLSITDRADPDSQESRQARLHRGQANMLRRVVAELDAKGLAAVWRTLDMLCGFHAAAARFHWRPPMIEHEDQRPRQERLRTLGEKYDWSNILADILATRKTVDTDAEAIRRVRRQWNEIGKGFPEAYDTIRKKLKAFRSISGNNDRT